MRASLHRTAIGQLERAERVARIDTLIKLAGALGVSPGELLTGLSWEPGNLRHGHFVDAESSGLEAAKRSAKA